jgi:hypothetical protein
MVGLEPTISGRESTLTFPRFPGLRFASPENDGGRDHSGFTPASLMIFSQVAISCW